MITLDQVWAHPEETVAKFNAILSRGLCTGMGSRYGQMCIEAAICTVLDMPHGDAPVCVTPAVRRYKIRLNDSPRWLSPKSRADGLRALGLAQIGSAGVVDGAEFSRRLSEQTIRVLIPDLFRRFTDRPEMLAAADRCEKEGTRQAAADAGADASYATSNAAYAAYAAYAASYAAFNAAFNAAYTFNASDASDAASAADNADAAFPGVSPEYYLRLSAGLALDVLRELKSPGVALLDVPRQR